MNNKQGIKKLILLLFILFSNTSLAQLDTLSCYSSPIQNISEYVHRAIQQDENVDQLRRLMQKWYRIERDAKKINRVVDQLFYFTVVKREELSAFKKLALKWGSSEKLLRKIKKKHVRLFEESKLLFDLYSLYAINLNFSEKYVYLESLCEELDVYGLQAGMEIVEIGAGQGAFSLLLLKGYSGVKIAVNELDPRIVDYINQSYAQQLSDNEKIAASIIIGEEDDAKILRPVDKIIIRNSFHHFEKMDEMLISIKKALKPNGELFLKETYKSELGEHSGCKLKMTRSEILEVTERNGLVLSEERALSKGVILKFQLAGE